MVGAGTPHRKILTGRSQSPQARESTGNVRRSPVRLCTSGILAMVTVGIIGCHVAPVRTDGRASPPPTWRYAGPHGRPLAYGGDVCAVVGSHTHVYPPVPAQAFGLTPGGAKDMRPRWAYVDAHRHGGRTCFQTGWHLHLEPPDRALALDERLGAFVEPQRPLP